jgi:hypothetical protein
MTGRAKIPLLAGEWTKVLISAVVVIALDPGVASHIKLNKPA